MLRHLSRHASKFIQERSIQGAEPARCPTSPEALWPSALSIKHSSISRLFRTLPSSRTRPGAKLSRLQQRHPSRRAADGDGSLPNPSEQLDAPRYHRRPNLRASPSSETLGASARRTRVELTLSYEDDSAATARPAHRQHFRPRRLTMANKMANKT